jgi:hypothetical protein
MPRPLCHNRTCSNSVIIQHVNGNTMDNRVANLKVLGFLPVGNHAQNSRCGTNPNWRGLHVFTEEQCNELRDSGKTTDIDVRE